jgi:tyrosine-protein phosphatase YwqE
MNILGKIFQKKEPLVPVDLSFLGGDIHSHLIPGIDDGSPSMSDSLVLAQGMVDLGYQKAVTTPHVMSDFYRNTPEIIKKGLLQLNGAIKNAGIKLTVEAAAEYYIDYDFLKKIGNEELLTFGQRYILVEFSFVEPPRNMKEAFFELQTNGYKPILAHPERYLYWNQNPKELLELKDRDVLFQVNLLSLFGNYGPEICRAGEFLIEHRLVEWLGTDMHHANHLVNLKNYQLKASLAEKIHQLPLLNQNLL